MKVLGNHISLTMTTLLTSASRSRPGKVVPLAVTTLARHPAYPEIAALPSRVIRTCAATPGSGFAGPKTCRWRSSAGSMARSGGSNTSAKMREYFERSALSTRDLDCGGGGEIRRRRICLLAPLARRSALTVQNKSAPLGAIMRHRLRLITLACLCALAAAPGRSAGISSRTIRIHRPVPGGRPDRHPLAHRRPEDAGGLGPAGGGREPPRRRHRDRRPAGRQGRARRLHAARRNGHHAGAQSRTKTSLSYDPFKDFAAITLAAKNTSLLIGARRRRPQDDRGADRARKANPGKLNYGAGIITTRLAGYMFTRPPGSTCSSFPYKGSAEVVQGLLTGAVDYHHRRGRLEPAACAEREIPRLGQAQHPAAADAPPTCRRCRSPPPCRRSTIMSSWIAFSPRPARRARIIDKIQGEVAKMYATR